MPGLFEALAKMPKREPRRFLITVQDVEHEVTVEKFKWAKLHGEDNLMLRDGEIIVKPKPKPKTRYSVLKKSAKGYTFHDSDIHWPNAVVQGGETWQIEYE